MVSVAREVAGVASALFHPRVYSAGGVYGAGLLNMDITLYNSVLRS